MSEPKVDIHCQKLSTLLQNWEYIGKSNLREIRKNEAIKDGRTEKEADQIAAASIESDEKAPEIWLPVLIASGWATRGPVDNPTPPG